MLSLTIVVPFLGSLLLFNQHVVDLLTLSPDLVRRWMKLSVEASEVMARQLTLSRLYYVYFGLTFLGVGSALFAMFCPQIVKNYASSIGCVQAESSLVTGSRIALIVSDVSLSYAQWLDEEHFVARLPSTIRQLGLPDDFFNLCSVALVEVFSDLPSELFEHNPSTSAPQASSQQASASERSGPINDPDEPFYDRRGQPAPDRIALALVSGRRRIQWFVRAFHKEAGSEKHRNDMLALHYMALDNTRPRLRILVAFFYGLGFALLAIPTVITFAQLTWHILH